MINRHSVFIIGSRENTTAVASVLIGKVMNIFFPVEPDHLSHKLKEIIFQSPEYVFDPCANGPKHYKIHSPSKGIFFDCWLVSTDIGLDIPSSEDSAICIVNWEGLEKPVHDFINYLTQHISQIRD